MPADLSILVKTTQVSGGRRVLFDIAATALTDGLTVEVRTQDGASAAPAWWPSPAGIAWRGFDRGSNDLGRVCLTSRLSIAGLPLTSRVVLLAQGVPAAPLWRLRAWLRERRDVARALARAAAVWAIDGTPAAWWSRRAPVDVMPTPPVDAAFATAVQPAPPRAPGEPLRIVAIGNGKSTVKNMATLYRALDLTTDRHGVPVALTRITPTGPTAAEATRRDVAFVNAVSAAEVARIIDSAHLLVAPSRAQEGFGLAPREAIARMRPFLASHIASHRVALDGLPDAFYYGAPGDADDADGLATAIRRFADAPQTLTIPDAIYSRVIGEITARRLAHRAVALVRAMLS
jgi:glycosyltransferase involved in cell wall biosynthesis